MTLQFEYIEPISYIEEPDINNLYHAIQKLNESIQMCHTNIKIIAHSIEDIAYACAMETQKQLIKDIIDIVGEYESLVTRKEELMKIITQELHCT